MKVLVFVANGSEEIETLTVVDVLRRAGATVTLASVEATAQVSMSRGVNVVADVILSSTDAHDQWDAVVVPGGMPGATRIRDSAIAREIVLRQASRRAPVAAICAAPAATLGAWGVLEGVSRVTCHPGLFKDLGPKGVEDRVVTDGFLTTSRGPGTALEFALRLVAILFGEEQAKKVAAPMLVPAGTI